MNPRLFLAHAGRMLVEKRPEAYRSAVSRAYYAVYNVAANLLAEMGLPLPRGAGGHAEAQHRLRNCKDAELEDVGLHLNSLQSRRLQADYRLERRDIEDEATATELVGLAGSLIVILDACRRDPARLERIKTGIAAYLAGSGRNGA